MCRIIPTVGYGCSLCVVDGELLICTERCDDDTTGYTEEESRQRMAAHRDQCPESEAGQ
jgi:hypothetical protein